MKLFDSIAKRFGFVSEREVEGHAKAIAHQILKFNKGQRAFQAGSIDRLTADWLAGNGSGDTEMRSGYKTMRNRSRQLERDEDYYRRWLALRENNVLGHCGIGLQMKCLKNGQPDKVASQAIEDYWCDWGRKENCAANRRMTWRQVEGLILRSAGRDGGVFKRDLEGFQNKHNFAVQPLEIDHLAFELDTFNPNSAAFGLSGIGGVGGLDIRMGIELDEWQAPVAYYLWPQHPGDWQGVQPGRRPIRVPSREISHIFMPDRISQVIAAPASCSAMARMRMLGAYEEAELVAAREAACKGRGIIPALPDGYDGTKDDQGRIIEPVEPGMTQLFNPGDQVVDFDPKHPVDAFGDFTKSIIRGVASGLGVSYTSLSNDLEGVNYSSIRAGLLEEREEWKTLQEWLIAELHTPTFEKWLRMQLLMGTIVLPNGQVLTIDRYNELNKPCWTPRRWPWVDPQKDVEANRVAIACRLKSRKQVISEDGDDIDEIDADFEADPVTNELDTESAYVPVKGTPEPASEPVPVKNGNGNGSISGNGRMTLLMH